MTLSAPRVPPQRCLGLALRAQGVAPRPSVDLSAAAAAGDYRYACLGYALHPSATPSAGGPPAQPPLPYCSGVEVIAREPDPAGAPARREAREAGAAAAAATRRAEAERPAPTERPGYMRGGGTVSTKDLDTFLEKWKRSAGRILDRMALHARYIGKVLGGDFGGGGGGR